MRYLSYLPFAVVATVSFVFSATVLADDDDGIKPIEITGNIGVTSDLRDRGLTLSDQDFSPTFSLNVDHESGFYGGFFFATNLETPTGGDTEIEFYGGYSFAADAYVIDFSAEMDSFFGGLDDRSFSEFKASISRDFGLAYIRTGVSYAPDGRWFSPDRDSLYFRADLEVPWPSMPELTIISRFGYDIRESRADIADWGIGASYFIGDIELSVMFEDSAQNGPFGQSNVTAGIRYFF